MRIPATSTNSDLYVVPMEGGEPKKITTSPGADDSPAVLPRRQVPRLAHAVARRLRERPLAAAWSLERATGKVTILTENLDRWVTASPGARFHAHRFFTAEDRGRQDIQMIPVDRRRRAHRSLSGASALDDMQFTADGKTHDLHRAERRRARRRSIAPSVRRRRAVAAHAI